MSIVKKIIVLVLAGSLILGSIAVNAEDIASGEVLTETQSKNQALIDKWFNDNVSVENMLKYDFVNEDSTEDEDSKQIGYPEQIKLVLALKLMELEQDGLFHEEQIFPYNEFAKIMLMLTTGEISSIADLYDKYGESRPVTYEEAIKHLVSALGYEPMVKNENYIAVAGKIGLMDNAANAGGVSGPVTKGTLAKLLYNALYTDMMIQTVYGNTPDYSVEKGATLLTEKFQVFKVEGMITAVEGLNLYSTVLPQKGEIYIDKIPYEADDVDTNGLIGYRINGYAKIVEDKSHLIYLEVDSGDDMLEISTSDIVQLTPDKLTYELPKTGKSKTVSLNSVEAVLLGANHIDKSRLSNDLIYENYGTIVLSREKGDNKYTSVVIKTYKDVVVDRVDLLSKRILFKDGFILGDSKYISFEEDDDRIITVIKNGVEIPVEEIKSSDVISVMCSNSKNYIYIVVSNEKVSGMVDNIETQYGNQKVVTINDKEYNLSPNFYKILTSGSDYANLAKKEEGQFLLNFKGSVVSYKETKAVYSYAIMTKLQVEDGWDPKVSVRLFCEDGAWRNYAIAEEATIDGEQNVQTRTSRFDADDYFNSQYFYKPVRYKLNKKGEIDFIDTENSSDAELSDEKRIRQSAEWAGKIDYTLAYDLEPITYSVSDKAVIFALPSDLEEEDEYSVIGTKNLKDGQTASLVLYSADEFFVSNLVVFGGVVETSYDRKNTFAINKVMWTVNDKGEDVIKLKGLKGAELSLSRGEWVDTELFLTAKASQKFQDLKKGDIIRYVLTPDGEITKLRAVVKEGVLPEDHLETPGNQNESASGTIVKIDTERAIIKMLITDPRDPENEEKWVYRTYTPSGIMIYDKSTGEMHNVKITELHEGDRMWLYGANRAGMVVVVR